MTDISLFDYQLPEESIAQYPTKERDESRLFIIDRAGGKIEHKVFSDLPEYLRAGDVLVLNDTRVIRARLLGEKEGTGAQIELLLTKQIGKNITTKEIWQALARPAKRVHPGDKLVFAEGFSAEVEDNSGDGFVRISFQCEKPFKEMLGRYGHVPLPPYIRREDVIGDVERYQTIYAKKPGSVAAPTAGLHFTDKLLAGLRKNGVETCFITLHVGLGTFKPVQTKNIEDHDMHEEQYYIGEEARNSINAAKAEGRRVICVGTTSARAIESAGVMGDDGVGYIPEENNVGSTDIFFYPGGPEFFMTDALITNFHLPRSTLLMLVSAFYDREKILEAYSEALEKQYRFFSYGDAMLIL